MDSSVVLFELLHVIVLLLFVISSVYADDSPALQNPDYCFDQYARGCKIPIEYPLQVPDLSSDSCGYPGFYANCDQYEYGGNPFVNISHHIYRVLGISYEQRSIQMVDMGIDVAEGSCVQPKRNFSFPSSPSWVKYNLYGNNNVTIFYNCSSKLGADAKNHLLCSEDYYKTTNTPPSYAFYGHEIPRGSDWYGNCAENVVVPVIDDQYYNYSIAMKIGFKMGWSAADWCEDCERSVGHCWSTIHSSTSCACGNSKSHNRSCPPQTPPLYQGEPPTPSTTLKSQRRMNTGLKIGIGLLSGIGGILLLALLVLCKGFNCSSLSVPNWRHKNKSPINIELFLEKYDCLALQRYTYSEIKKMTNSFKDALGQGGYGRVFKGELHNGRLVAVKQLDESKGDGEDFINEVATIGKTNHVNVVNLVGFCIEGTRRALVYEFMPNGSLERFIYTQKESSTTLTLGWEKLYQIALGIARGLEYLHRGCNTRILHFDIKPHNILLDQNFCPKISDFGLAKLYTSSESVVSTVGARGTMGYIAPELCCRTFGSVSHKSDVYSYGMMMLEMIGGRKNIDATVDNISEIYFPLWIYNHIKQRYDADALEEIQARELFEDERAKKMILVALWCIQAHPIDRPSMREVIEMLEGNTHEIQIPPNPSIDPRSRYSTSS